MTLQPRLTENVPEVDPQHLRLSYIRCSHVFGETETAGSIKANDVLAQLSKIAPLLDPDQIFDLFRRLCLSVQLIADIDARWIDNGMPGTRPEAIPFAFYIFASAEAAFEDQYDGYTNTYFAREVVKEATSLFRLH